MSDSVANPPADYRKWARRDLWTFVEAATLAIGLEPVRFPPVPEDHESAIEDGHLRHMWRELYENLKRSEAEGTLPTQTARVISYNGGAVQPLDRARLRPVDFVAWASQKGFAIPQRLVDIVQREATSSDKDTQELSVQVTEPNWKMSIQMEAARRWRSLLAAGASPTKNGLKRHLAHWCRDNDVKTQRSSIHPDAEYIYRHVLRSWKPPTD
jgi:hypothetical protein